MEQVTSFICLGRVSMLIRSEILDTLAASHAQVMAYFQGLSAEALERPCTASGVPGEPAWRAKNHFAHLAQNERNIQQVLRSTLTGVTSLPGNLGAMSPEERLAMANRRNQSYVTAHRDDTMETLIADLAAARQETLDLLDQFTDEQLAAPLSLSTLADRTAGDLFVANAQHATAHIRWIEEGFRQGLSS
ncbi:MAG TPA: DinB family protein [Ktedonobacterales bacterium]|nr:DinB family protein [Ktedonobacterales bacterium]